MQKINIKKNTELQRGLVKEIIVVVAVIFTLSYFSIDPTVVWEKMVSVWNYFFG